MPLIKCPDCGKMISPFAEICLGCGHPIEKTIAKVKNKSYDKLTESELELLADLAFKVGGGSRVAAYYYKIVLENVNLNFEKRFKYTEKYWKYWLLKDQQLTNEKTCYPNLIREHKAIYLEISNAETVPQERHVVEMDSCTDFYLMNNPDEDLDVFGIFDVEEAESAEALEAAAKRFNYRFAYITECLFKLKHKDYAGIKEIIYEANKLYFSTYGTYEILFSPEYREFIKSLESTEEKEKCLDTLITYALLKCKKPEYLALAAKAFCAPPSYGYSYNRRLLAEKIYLRCYEISTQDHKAEYLKEIVILYFECEPMNEFTAFLAACYAHLAVQIGGSLYEELYQKTIKKLSYYSDFDGKVELISRISSIEDIIDTLEDHYRDVL